MYFKPGQTWWCCSSWKCACSWESIFSTHPGFFCSRKCVPEIYIFGKKSQILLMSAYRCHCQMPQSVVPQSPYDPQFQLFVFFSSFSPDWHSSPSKLTLTLLYLFTIVYQGTHPLCPVWVFPMAGLVVIEGGHHPGRAGALAGQGQRHTAQAGGVVTGVAVQLVTAQVLYLPPFILHFKSRYWNL